MMDRRFYLAIAIIVLFAGVVWFADPFVLIIFGVAPLLWIGLPAVLIATILLIVARRTGCTRRPALFIFSLVGGVGCFVALALPANYFVQQRAVSDAKAYPDQIAPLLEAYRHAHGSYPERLEHLPAKPSVPRLIRRTGDYHSNGRSYSFVFSEPGSFIDAWHYDSDTRAWQFSD